MGTDITFMVEEKSADGTWKLTNPLEKNLDYNPEDPDLKDEPEFIPTTIDLGRNYCMFAILANVRNGSRSEGKFIPISKPKGLPKGTNKFILNWYKSWEDCFDPSWLTYQEIINFDWTQIIQREAMVDPEAAHLFQGNPLGFPKENWPKHIQISYAVHRDLGRSR